MSECLTMSHTHKANTTRAVLSGDPKMAKFIWEYPPFKISGPILCQNIGPINLRHAGKFYHSLTPMGRYGVKYFSSPFPLKIPSSHPLRTTSLYPHLYSLQTLNI